MAPQKPPRERLRFADGPTLLAIGLTVTGLAVTGWSLANVVGDATRIAAMQSAAMLSETILAFRSLYTSEVVAKLENEGGTVPYVFEEPAGTFHVTAG